MRNTTVRKIALGEPFRTLAPEPRQFARRMPHPRRDPEGHGTGGKTGEGEGKTGDDGKTGDGKTGEEGKNGGEGKETKPVPVTETKEYKALQTSLADVQTKLDAELQKGMSEDEKTRAATQKQAITDAVKAKEVEITDAYATVVAGLQGQIIHSVIDGQLAAVGRRREEFKTIFETLDTGVFLGDDGAVKTELVKKYVSELAGSSTSRPPRTSSGASSSSDRGFGRYLNKDK